MNEERKKPPLPPRGEAPDTTPGQRPLNEGQERNDGRRKVHDERTVWRNVNDSDPTRKD